MWMGGTVPLGYDVQDRKLVVNEAEAETVRHIFRSYLAVGSVRLLQEQLAREGIRSKARPWIVDQKMRGGRLLARGALYTLLQNRLYRGEVAHKGAVHPGEHQAIVDQELWDAVQARLAENQVERSSGDYACNPSLLVGLLYNEGGQRLVPTHAVKAGRQYRYYISKPLITEGRDAAPTGRRIPAGDIERLATERIRQFLASEAEVFQALRPGVPEAAQQRRMLDRAAALAQAWPELAPAEQRGILRALLARIELHAGRVDLHLLPNSLSGVILGEAGFPARRPPPEMRPTATPLVLSVPAVLKRAGLEMKLIVDGPDGARNPDPALLKLMSRAQRLRDRLLQGDGAGVGELAERDGITASYFTRVVRLALLAPDITTAILNGCQPRDLTAARLLRESHRLPLDWREQRQALGFG
jgi:site-specific DNA recombinase